MYLTTRRSRLGDDDSRGPDIIQRERPGRRRTWAGGQLSGEHGVYIYCMGFSPSRLVGRANTWVEIARTESRSCVDLMSKNIVGLLLIGSLVLWPCHWPLRPFLEESFCSQIMQVFIRVSRYFPHFVLHRSAAARALLLFNARGVRRTRRANSKRRRESTHEAAWSLPIRLRRGR